MLGNVVEIPDLGDILLDCGEGTFGQLVRCYGQAGVADALRRLRAVFISHNHGDHHMGLSRVLSKRRQVRSARLHAGAHPRDSSRRTQGRCT